MSVIQIPLSQLRVSPRNPRTLGAEDVQDLVPSIRTNGLLHNLVVRAAEHEPNLYDVEAGGRRLRALQALRDLGEYSSDFPVSCRLLAPGEALDAAAHENESRKPLHPADQVTVFAGLAKGGQSEADIAAKFGMPPRTVAQRLKLSRVAKPILDDYRVGKLHLEQVEAYAIADSADDQLAHYKAARKSKRDYELEPEAIRRALLRNEIDPRTDRRCRVVTVEEYEAAGGAVHRDLFDDQSTGYLQDPKLLDRLLKEKLQAEAERIKEKEGWQWAEGRVSFDNDGKLGRFGGRWDRTRSYTAEEKAVSGVIVTVLPYLDDKHRFEVHRGMIHADQAAAAAKLQKAAGVRQVRSTSHNAAKRDAATELRQVLDATLQAQLLEQPQIALQVLALTLLKDLAAPYGSPGVCDIGSNGSSGVPELLRGTTAGKAIEAARAKWTKALPKGDAQAWAWIQKQPAAALNEILVVATALACSSSDYGGKHNALFPELARSVALDVRRWWKPTAKGYLDKLSKDQVLAALREAGLNADAVRLEKVKAATVAAEAEQLLTKAGWLPKELRVAAEVKKPPARRKPTAKPAKKAKRK